METTSAGYPTAGALLRQARQQRGLHIAALAVQLKVPQSKLEAIESDRWADLPDATFARALATSMCRALKIEPGPVLEVMPTWRDKPLDVPTGLNTPFRERGVSVEGATQLAKPMVWGPALILLLAAAVYFFPAEWWPGRSASKADAASTGPVPTLVEAPMAASPVASPPQAVVAAASVPTLSTAAVATPSLPIASAPLRALPASEPVVLAAKVPAAAPVAAAGTAPLRLTASQEAWAEVVDAQGQLQFSRLLRAGESVTLDVLAPIKLRLGKAPVTRVHWRNADVDPQASTKGDVVRLELN
jgi:cytoskeleton protein RodZ